MLTAKDKIFFGSLFSAAKDKLSCFFCLAMKLVKASCLVIVLFKCNKSVLGI